MSGRTYAVAAAHPEAVEVGLRVLEEGGDACDAAVAVSLALGVAEPFYSGIGGGGVTLIWRASEKRASFIDFSNECASGVRPGMFEYDENGKHIGTDHSHGHRSILVPGLLRGLEAVHQDFGKIPWEQLVGHAIQLAEEGVPVNWFYRMHQASEWFSDRAERYAELPKVHTKDGRLLDEEEILRQPDLAATLRLIAEKGPDFFYTGELADAICGEMRQGGGLVEKEDLAAYRVRRLEPLTGTYRGLSCFTAPLPSSGLILIQALNLMELLVKDFNSASESERVSAWVKSMQFAFRDRFSVYGDPSHFDVDVEKLQSKAYAEKHVNEAIGADAHAHDRRAGSTTHFTIVDGDGNAVCQTQTLGMSWGSGVMVPGRGILLNNHTNWMDPRHGRGNSLGPGRRPMAGFSPTLVLENGSLRLVVGSPGSYRIPTAVSQVIMNRFDRGMALQEALEAPRIHLDIGPVEVEKELDPKTNDLLLKAGFEVSTPPFPTAYFGGVHAVEISPDGSLMAAADPRRGGTAEVR